MTFKSGYVCILGKPNVGKSTLMNKLIGERLSITTPKPGTTRDKIFGVLTKSEGQIVFIDTPGFHQPKLALGRHMVHEAKNSIQDADLAILMTDVEMGWTQEDEDFARLIKGAGIPALCVINKSDAARKSELLPLIDAAGKMYKFNEIIPTSCRSGENLDRLLGIIYENLPVGEPYFADGELTDRSERFFVGEKIREKALFFLQEEVPHSVAVKVEEMIEKPEKNMWIIKATLYVEKESQKGIIIGKGGLMLKKIGEASRKTIESFLSRKVFLELWVKVLKDWRKDDKALKDLGYHNKP